MLFLFKKDTNGLGKPKTVIYWIYQHLMVLLSSIALGLLCLIYAYGSNRDMLETYFDNFLIILLNVLPVVIIMLLLYYIIGRAWIAFLATSVLTLAMSVGNMYKIVFRDDPFIFADVPNIFLGIKVATGESYNITMSGRIWLAIACTAFGTAFMFFLVRGKIKPVIRLPLVLIPIIAAVSVWGLYTSSEIYYNKTANNSLINRWATNQVYVSKGFFYPFLHSINDYYIKPPEGYKQKNAEAYLAEYTDADIPREQKVDIIFIMREAYNDFSKYEDIEGVDFSIYDTYHDIKNESYSGKLFTNIFGGGTVDTERSVMTGSYMLENYRANTNSYVRYFKSQGYTVEGSHPSFTWFYNRLNINKYLGFDNYYFFDDYYKQFQVDENYLPLDYTLYNEMINLYENRDKDKPYFSFNVTYQGHGPYPTSYYEWGRDNLVFGDYSDYSKYVINNYLGTLASSDSALRDFIDYYKASDRPVVICVFGDHNPWLGDNNSVYKELGIDLESGSEESVHNYYDNEYIIWANDKAKETLGFDFVGEGPAVSPFYLMNVMFRLNNWDGPAYMQLMDTFLDEMPIASSNEIYQLDGKIVSEIPDTYKSRFAIFEQAQYYWLKKFIQ